MLSMNLYTIHLFNVKTGLDSILSESIPMYENKMFGAEFKREHTTKCQDEDRGGWLTEVTRN